MKNYSIPVVIVALLIGCTPNKQEQATLLSQVRESILESLHGDNKYEIATLKMKVTGFDERLMGWVEGEWIACAEAVPLSEGKAKLSNKKFIFVNKSFSPLIIEDGKYPELDKGNAILWRDLCSFK